MGCSGLPTRRDSFRSSDTVRRLCSAASLPEAHLLRALLDQAGIAAHVFNEHAQSGIGELPFTHAYPEVWIADDTDLEAAYEVLRKQEHVSSGAERPCPGCHEINPPAFETCWRCGSTIVP
ncbi:MAG: DUF2007 domain-containing protein [Betaproteobacteria bacterium]|nr:DUF2007 domain-containing protein [Betaproteobacteria bacterium]